MKTAAALVLVLALRVSGQTPYIETFEVRLHNLDVAVTDAKGVDEIGVQRMAREKLYEATGNAAKARRVEVKVRNRPELRVRTRTEVIEKSTSSEMADLTIASLIYPRDVNELAIEVTAGKPVPTRGFFTIPLDIVIPMEKLTFLQNGSGGKYVASFDVHFAAAGQERDFMTGGKQQQVVEITPEQYAELEGVNYRYQTGINVAEGQSKIAIGVLDTTTKLTGFQTVDVDAQ